MPNACGCNGAAWAATGSEPIEDLGPVFEPGDNSGKYPCMVFDPNGFGQPGTPSYRLYYNEGSDTWLAASGDGVTFDNKVPVKQGASHARVIYDPHGFGGGAPYRMYYWVKEKENLTNPDSLRCCESQDGVNWSNDRPLQQQADSPLINPQQHGAWNFGSYGLVDVKYNPAGSTTPTDDDVMANRYVAYYDVTDGRKQALGLAYSSDGITWKRYGDAPVLECSADDGAWDSCHASWGSVVWNGDHYEMWYTGGKLDPASGQRHRAGVGVATSPDGIHWTKGEGPIPALQKEWCMGEEVGVWVLYNPVKKCYEMWRAAQGADGIFRVGYARVAGLAFGWSTRGADGALAGGSAGRDSSGAAGDGSIASEDLMGSSDLATLVGDTASGERTGSGRALSAAAGTGGAAGARGAGAGSGSLSAAGSGGAVGGAIGEGRADNAQRARAEGDRSTASSSAAGTRQVDNWPGWMIVALGILLVIAGIVWSARRHNAAQRQYQRRQGV